MEFLLGDKANFEAPAQYDSGRPHESLDIGHYNSPNIGPNLELDSQPLPWDDELQLGDLGVACQENRENTLNDFSTAEGSTVALTPRSQSLIPEIPVPPKSKKRIRKKNYELSEDDSDDDSGPDKQDKKKKSKLSKSLSLGDAMLEMKKESAVETKAKYDYLTKRDALLGQRWQDEQAAIQKRVEDEQRIQAELRKEQEEQRKRDHELEKADRERQHEIAMEQAKAETERAKSESLRLQLMLAQLQAGNNKQAGVGPTI
jgi:hypothetical protein